MRTAAIAVQATAAVAAFAVGARIVMRGVPVVLGKPCRISLPCVNAGQPAGLIATATVRTVCLGLALEVVGGGAVSARESRAKSRTDEALIERAKKGEARYLGVSGPTVVGEPKKTVRTRGA